MTARDYLDFKLPCTEPGREDDWFIEDTVSPTELEDHRARIQGQLGRSLSDTELAAELTRRRRDAIASCSFDCPLVARRRCLAEGLEGGNALKHGIRGGYAARERRIMLRMAKEREAGRVPNEALVKLFTQSGAERREALDSR